MWFYVLSMNTLATKTLIILVGGNDKTENTIRNMGEGP